MSGALVGVLDNRLTYSVKENPHAKDGLVALGAKICDSAKGVSDVFGLLQKGTQLFHTLLPKAVTPLSERVLTMASAGRDMTALPRAVAVTGKLFETQDPRDGGELLKVTALSVAALHPERAAAQKYISAATMAGVVVDAVDLFRENKLRNECAVEVPKGTNEQVKKAVDNQRWVSTLKMAKLCLQMFSGIVGTMAWIMAVTLEAPVALAALVASFSAILISFGLQYVEHTSELTSKIMLVQPKKVPETT